MRTASALTACVFSDRIGRDTCSERWDACSDARRVKLKFLQHSTGPTGNAFSSSLGLWWVLSDRQKFLQANTGLTDIVAGTLVSCKWMQNCFVFCVSFLAAGNTVQQIRLLDFAS